MFVDPLLVQFWRVQDDPSEVNEKLLNDFVRSMTRAGFVVGNGSGGTIYTRVSQDDRIVEKAMLTLSDSLQGILPTDRVTITRESCHPNDHPLDNRLPFPTVDVLKMLTVQDVISGQLDVGYQPDFAARCVNRIYSFLRRQSPQ